MNDDYGSIQFQCPVVKPVANLNDAWTGTLLCMVLTLALALLLVSYKSYKMAKQAIEGCKRMQTQVDQLHELVNILRRANNELEGNHEMLSDEVADMLRAQRLRQAGESEVPAIPAGDPVVVVPPAAAPVPLSNLGQVHEMLSNEIDACVRREAFSQAEQFREAVTFILDSMNRAQPLARSTRIHFFQRLGDCLERLADQNRVLGEHTVGEQYQRFADRLRDLAFVD
jgi:FtsZ-binding cell division protein ZapB